MKKSIQLEGININKNKLKKMQNRLQVLKHINKRNCALLPYLNDESLHTLGEFLYNIISQRIPLNNKESIKTKRILLKNRDFYTKLMSSKTKNPFTLLKKNISNNQIGGGIISILSFLAPLVTSLLTR